MRFIAFTVLTAPVSNFSLPVQMSLTNTDVSVSYNDAKSPQRFHLLWRYLRSSGWFGVYSWTCGAPRPCELRSARRVRSMALPPRTTFHKYISDLIGVRAWKAYVVGTFVVSWHSQLSPRNFSPGRFFAVTELKMMMVHILSNYDLKLEDGTHSPANLWHATSITPDPNVKVLFRKRRN